MGLELLVGTNPKVDKVAEGFTFTEGPVFSRTGYLLFSDVRANRILRWDSGKVKPFREKSNGASGLTFDHQGRLLTCEHDRVTRTEKDGSITASQFRDLTGTSRKYAVPFLEYLDQIRFTRRVGDERVLVG